MVDYVDQVDDVDVLPPIPVVGKPMVQDNPLMKNYMQKGSKGAQADAAETISCNLTFDF